MEETMFARSSSALARPARRRRFLASPALTIAAIAIAGTGSVALAADASVSIVNFAYSPSSVTINVGDSVTWTNNDDVAHTATANDGSFDTGSFGSGQSRAVTFNAAGSFPYRCSIHPQMIGTVVVQAAAATPAPSAPAPGATPRPTTPGTDASLAGGTPTTDGGTIAILGMTAIAFALAIRRLGQRAR
jgi:plastocyanin